MVDAGQEYEDATSPLRDFAPHLETLIRALLVAEGVEYHYVSSRVKTKTSTLRKLQKPGKKYSGIADLTDMLGIRIVTYFPDDVDAVAQIVRREFAIDADNSVDKREALESDQFGYLSLHFVASLSGSRTTLAEYNPYIKCSFEIQIRSILQHAWAEIEHDLGYKSSHSIPKEVRRRFSRLAGLLELADAEFVEIRKILDTRNRQIEQAVEHRSDLVTLDPDTLFLFIRRDAVSRRLDRLIGERIGEMVAPSSRGYAETIWESVERLEMKTWNALHSNLISRVDILPTFASVWIFDLYEEDEEAREDVSHLGPVPAGLGIYYYYLWEVASGRISPDITDPDLQILKRAKAETMRLLEEKGKDQ